jgi:hypothetical protein
MLQVCGSDIREATLPYKHYIRNNHAHLVIARGLTFLLGSCSSPANTISSSIKYACKAITVRSPR